MNTKHRLSFLSRLHSYLQWRKRTLCTVIIAALSPSFAFANPTGAQVISGQVTIDQTVAGITTVTNSPNAIINWQDFNIAQNEITRFIQQNGQSAVLNRIIGGNPSEILGSLFSNGKVFLINPNGIVFGAGSQIDTQGLIASSLNLSDSDFKRGNFHFIAGSKAGDISNEGIIHAGKDGNIVLIAPNIENKGIIHSEGGKIVLAAGQELVLTSLDDPEIRFQIQAPKNHVVNVGELLSEGGSVNVFAGSIKHSGDISADSVEVDKQGNIRLVAKGDVTLEKDSKTSANNEKGVAGKIEITGENVAVLDNSKLSASGQKGGGEILIGGDYQGKNPAVQNAQTTTIAEKVEIQADAKTEGKGGKVVVWSDNETKVAANLSAKGGKKSGDGGLVETSGKNLKIADSTKVSTKAPKGKTGTWLLDPTDFTIASGSDALTTSGIGASTLSSSLSSTNQNLSATGVINVNSPVSWTINKLTLSAGQDIYINAALNGSGTAQLALEYGQVTTGDYFVHAPINLPAGANFSTKLGAAAAIPYTVITDLGVAGDATLTTLQGMKNALSGNFALGGNIDASGTSSWNSGAGFEPVGDEPIANRFTGRFDGLGHTINNLNINIPARSHLGVFGYISNGSISNVGVVDENVIGNYHVGGLAGVNGTGSKIINSYTTGFASSSPVNLNSSGVGGLVGWNQGIISNSYSSNSVSGKANIGGLVGANGYATISNSYSTGSVTGSSDRIGGLVGYNSNAAIANSYSTGLVNGAILTGGLIGDAYNSTGLISNSFWDTQTSGQSTSSGGTGLTTAQMMAQANFTGFDFTNTWWISDTNTRPFLRSEWSSNITNAHQLQLMSSNLSASYTLGKNLDLSAELSNASGMWDVTKGFVPVGRDPRFTGRFDGLDHTISNLKINRPNEDMLGLFAWAYGATIKNIGLLDVNITTGARWYVGALAGMAQGASITNSYSTGSISTTGLNIGGLVGEARQAPTSNNYSTVNVSGSDHVGGLIGFANSDGNGNVLIDKSYSTGIVTGSATNVGGLVGRNTAQIANSYSTGNVTGATNVGGLIGNNGASINNSYSIGSVSGSSAVGGLIGLNSNATYTTNSFWDAQTSGQATSSGGTGLTTAQMMNLANFTTATTANGNVNPNWDFTNTWWMSDTNTRPFLRSEWSTTITNTHQLQLMASNLSASYTLGKNLDLSAELSNAAGMWNTTTKFVPIGNNSTPFTGSFDGLNNTISGLTINRPTSYVGVFGYSSGTIQNVGLTNVNVTGSNFVGGLLGWNVGNVSNSYSTGVMNGLSDVGGLLGWNVGNVSNSYSTGAVSGIYNVGGLLGLNDAGSGSVNNSYSTGAVSGQTYIGGLVGINSGSVSNSYSMGTAGGESYIGGLAGSNAGSVSNSYSTTAVNGGTYIGGLLGWNSGSVSNSYSTGVVSGIFSVGGLIGDDDPLVSGTVTNSFWDTQTSGQATSAGGTGKTTEQMMAQANFTGFDFTNTWWMSDTNTRPFLRSEWSSNITNAHQLQLMSSNLSASYTLGKNLDLSAELSNAAGMWNTTTKFVPIGNDATSFTGKFDGLGHTINALTAQRPTENYIGLFGKMTAGTIQNVGVTNVAFSGSFNVGGLIGLFSGTVNNSYSTGSVSATNGYNAGGLAAYNLGGTLSNSYSSVNVSGTDTNVGGLLGNNDAGTVSNSYSTGSVSGTSRIGGLVGIIINNGSVTNSYSTGSVTGTSGVSGGMVGEVINGASVTNSFWDTTTSGKSTSSGGTGLTTTQMMTQASFTGFDFTNTWWMSDTNTRPFLRSEWSTTITNAHQLQLMASNLSASYTLGKNLDLSAELSNASGMWDVTKGFVPVGNNSDNTDATRFTGKFDGLGHAIDRLTINRSTTINVGLFGAIGGTSIVQNVGVTNVNISGKNNTGGLVGVNFGGTTVSNSYSTGSVSGKVDNAGGLIGSGYYGSVSNSYSTSNVLGEHYVGGFMGQNYGTVSNSYSTGSVSGISNVGGLIGYKYSGTVSNSFWDTQTSGQATSAGGTGLTTAQMMSASTLTALGTPNWGGIADTSYPYLSWQFATAPQIISGTLAGSSISGKSIAFAVNGVAKNVLSTGANGFFYQALPANSITSSQNVLAWLDNDTNKAATLTNGSYLTNLKLELDTIYGQKDLDTTALNTVKGNISDSNIPFSFSGLTLTPAVTTLKANNDVVVSNAIATSGTNVSIKAGKSVTVNSGLGITTGGGSLAITANADSATDGINNTYRDAGQAVIQMQVGSNLDAGLGVGGVAIMLRKRENDTPNNAGAITLTNVTGGNVTIGNLGTYNVSDVSSGNVVLNGSVTTGTNNPIDIKATQDIVLAAGKTITTQGGAVTFNSDADTTNSGAIVVDTGASFTTNGGAITLGGGTNPLTDYAQGYAANFNGISINAGSLLNSNGGAITLHGKSYTGSFPAFHFGVLLNSGSPTVLNSGAGNIVIDGISTGVSTANSQGVASSPNVQVTSTTGNILINGSHDRANGSESVGVNWGGTVNTTTGNITLNGTSSATASIAEYGIFLYGKLLSESGAITLQSAYDPNSSKAVGVQTGWSTYTATVGYDGSLVSSSASPITIKADKFDLTASTFKSSGALTVQPQTANTTIGIAGGAGTLQLPVAYFSTNFVNGFSNINIGSASTGAMTLGAALTVPTSANLTLQNAGNMALNGALTLAANKTLTLNSTGTVSQTEPITATNLLLLGAGNYALTNINNVISNLAAGGVGNLSFVNSTAFAIDSVAGTNGINATGIVDISSYNGNLTINQPVITTNTTADALKLNAGSIETTTTTGNIIVGTNGSFSVGTGGIGKFFTGSILGSTGISNFIPAGNYRYNSDESVSNYTATITAAGKYAIYREQPKLRVNPNAATSSYGDTITSLAGTVNANDYINGDSGGVTGTPIFTTTATSSSHVGNYDVAYASGYSSAVGYGFADDTITGGEYSVTPRVLTPMLTNTGITKIYDQTPSVPVGFTPTYNYSGLASGDTGATVAHSAASYNSADVATANAIIVSGLTLGSITGTRGSLISDYVLDATSKNVAATITAKALTVTATGNNKVYDASTTATINLTDDRISGDILTTSYLSAVFADKNVGIAKTINVSGIGITGTDASNYTFNTTTTASADITQAALSITANAMSKTYGGIDPTLTYSTTGLMSGDTLLGSLTRASGENVGIYAISSTLDNPNYVITYTPADFTITAATLALAITADNTTRIYGAVNPTFTGQITTGGLQVGDTLASIGLSFSTTATQFSDVGSYPIVPSITSQNYVFSGTNGVLSITPASLTLTGLSASNKVYDATTNAVLNGGTLAGILNSDAVTLSGSLVGQFADKNVGTGKVVAISNYSLTGTKAANYTLTAPTGIVANITPATLNITATGTNKIYDGLTTATVNLADNRISGDVLTTSYTTAAFTDKNVGATKTINVSGIGIKGTDASNYTFNTTATASADITRAALSIAANTANKIYGTANPALTYTATGLISGDTLSGSLTRTNGENVGTYAITNNLVNTNYTIAYTPANFTITPAALSISANAANKVYGTTDPALTYRAVGLVNGDTLSGSLSRISGENVGNYAIQSNLTNSNYLISYTPADFTITPAALSITANAVSKVYGNTDVALTYNTVGLISGDSLSGSLSRVSGENVGRYAIQSNLTNDNYTITYTPADFTITPAALNIAANSMSKVYGTTDSALTYSATGLRSGDALTGALTRAAGENVGNYAIQSNLANSNYVITYTPANFSITPAALSVTAHAASKVYGGTDPALTYTATGLLSGDTLTGNVTRAVGENVGNYAIQSNLVNSNYTITYTPADFAITPAALNITANAASKVYGSVDPTLTYQTVGLVAGDTIEGSLSRAEGKNVGIYPITGNFNNANYTITYTPADFTITPAALSVTANAASKIYGETNPILTYQTVGLVDGDTLEGGLSRAEGKDVGIYPITGNFSNANYTIAYTPADFTITPAALNITANSASKIYGDADPELTYKTVGLIEGDTLEGSLTRAAGETVAKYGITGTFNAGKNYTVSFVPSELEITPAALQLVANDKTKLFGEPDPVFDYTVTGLKLDDTKDTVLSGNLSRDAGEEVAFYGIHQGDIKANSNYTLNYQGAKLEIKPVETIPAGLGSDSISGESTTDTITSGSGIDTILGETPIDVIPDPTAEAARLEAERLAAEQAKAEAERLAAEQAKAEAERLAAEQAKAEAERLAAEQAKAEAERLAAEQAKAEAERLAAEQAKAETERLAAEQAKAEAERLVAEQAKAEAERLVAEQAKAEAERLVAEQAKAEAERLVAEQAAKLKAEEERLIAEKTTTVPTTNTPIAEVVEKLLPDVPKEEAKVIVEKMDDGIVSQTNTVITMSAMQMPTSGSSMPPPPPPPASSGNDSSNAPSAAAPVPNGNSTSTEKSSGSNSASSTKDEKGDKKDKKADVMLVNAPTENKAGKAMQQCK